MTSKKRKHKNAKSEPINNPKAAGRSETYFSGLPELLSDLPAARSFVEFLNEKQPFDVEKFEIVKGRFVARFKEAGGAAFGAFIELPYGRAGRDAKIIERIISDPDLLSDTLNGRLPEFLNRRYREEVTLFLHGMAFTSHGCEHCRGQKRCRHVVLLMALFFTKLAEDPFLVFKLGGFDIIARVRARMSGEKPPPEVKAGDRRLRPPLEIPLAGDLLLASALENKEKPPAAGSECPDYFDYSAIPDLTAGAALLFPDKLKLYPGFDLGSWFARFYAVVRDEANLCVEKLKQGMARGYCGESAAVYDVEAGFDYSLKGRITIAGKDSLFDYFAADRLADVVKYVPVTHFRMLVARIKAICHYFRLALRLMARGAFYPQIIIAQKKTGYYYTVRWLAAGFNGEVNKLVEAMKKNISGGLVGFNGSPLGAAEQLNCFVSFFISAFINDVHNRNSIAADNPIAKILLSPPASVACTAIPLETVLEFNLKDAASVSYKIKPSLAVIETAAGFEIKLLADIPAAGNDGGFLKAGLAEFKDMNNLSAPDKAAFYSLCDSLFSGIPALKPLLAAGESGSITLSPADFFELRSGAFARLKNFGVHIDAPDTAEPEKPVPFLSLVDRSVPKKGRPAAGRPKELNGAGSAYLSLGELVKFDWRVAIGEKNISLDEFEALAKKSGGVIKIDGKYYNGDMYEIKKRVDASGLKPPRDFKMIMRAALSGEIEGRPLKIEDGASKILERLTAFGPVELPAGLRAKLREYQRRGYEWLYKNAKLSMGSVLADDMGLGKTVQAIALMLKLKEEGVIGDKKALVIVPTSLITNWVKEIEKFAPSLRVHVYHGQEREFKHKKADLIITTYGILRNDLADFVKKDWALLIADEAQNIKNPTAAQTKALKAVATGIKIAMSGTPIENRLLDLWSIFDLVNKGYLGSHGSFLKEIARPIEKSGCAKTLEKFKKMTGPFVLRRLKTDKNIIKDLPEKVEFNEFCSLTPVQAALYQKLVDEAMAPIKSADGQFARKGLILKLLTELKQVCNHPAQYFKAAAKAKPEESGKMMTFLEILDEILEAGEKCLVFTQFVETGKMLESAAGKHAGAGPLFLHGQCSRRERDAMIDKFQSDPAAKVFILSLRAGGTGINLTAASKVIHYDLWWNPAVEEQATSRAHRIGQTCKVMAYRMITAGTLEEKIERMLASKKKLAADAIEAGESWLGDLSDAELAELVKLEVDENQMKK